MLAFHHGFYVESSIGIPAEHLVPPGPPMEQALAAAEPMGAGCVGPLIVS